METVDLSINSAQKSETNSQPNNYQIDSQQGQRGTCQTLVIFNALNRWTDEHGNEVGEEYLADMVVDNGDGTYTVTFPGYDEPITVTDKQLEDLNLPDTLSSTNPELWQLLPILEAAYLQIHAKENEVIDPFDLFLGEDAAAYFMTSDMIDGPLFQELLAQTNNGQDLLISAGVEHDTTIMSIDVPPVEIFMPGSHAYTIIYEDGHYFILNPHDTSQRFELSESQVQDVFHSLRAHPAPGVEIDLPEHLEELGQTSQELNDAYNEYWRLNDGAYSLTKFTNILNDPYQEGHELGGQGNTLEIILAIQNADNLWQQMHSQHTSAENAESLLEDINADHALTSAAYAIVLTDLNNPDLKENALKAMRELVPEEMSQETYDAIVAEVERLDGNLLLDDNGNSVFDSPEEALAALREGTHPNSELQAAWNDTSHVTDVIADPSIYDDFGRNLGQALVSVENGNLDPRLPGDRTFPEGSDYYDALLSSGYQTAAHHNERDYEPSSQTIPDITIPDISIPDVSIPEITIPDSIFPDATIDIDGSKITINTENIQELIDSNELNLDDFRGVLVDGTRSENIESLEDIQLSQANNVEASKGDSRTV